MNAIVGAPLTFYSIWRGARRIFTRLRQHLGTSNSLNLAAAGGVGFASTSNAGATAAAAADYAIPMAVLTSTSVAGGGSGAQQTADSSTPSARRGAPTTSGHSLTEQHFTFGALRNDDQTATIATAAAAGDDLSQTISLTIAQTQDRADSAAHRRCKSDVGGGGGGNSATVASTQRSDAEPPNAARKTSIEEAEWSTALSRARECSDGGDVYAEIIDKEQVRRRKFAYKRYFPAQRFCRDSTNLALAANFSSFGLNFVGGLLAVARFGRPNLCRSIRFVEKSFTNGCRFIRAKNAAHTPVIFI